MSFPGNVGTESTIGEDRLRTARSPNSSSFAGDPAGASCTWHVAILDIARR